MANDEILGGEGLLAEAVEKFYTKLQSDPVVGEFFEDTDVASLVTHQRMFLTAALGGPDAYQGRDMRAAHAHLKIADVDFDLFMEHLQTTLTELGVSSERIDSVLEALSPLRREIVAAPGDGPDDWGTMDPTGGRG